MTPLQQFELHRPWATALGHRLRFPLSAVTREDVVSAALFGLWRACQRCPDLPVADFQRAAYLWVRGSVRDLFRSTSWVKRSDYRRGVRIELLYDIDWNWFSYDAFENDNDVDDQQLDRRRLVSAAIDKLNPIDRRVLVECFMGERKHEDMARELGVSPPRISQRLKRALDTLRAELLKTG